MNREQKATDRTVYRKLMRRNGLVPFRVCHLETDLFIQASQEMKEQVSDWVVEARMAIESYGRAHPDFFSSLLPLPMDDLAPGIVKKMLDAAISAGVGPMAAVAGAIAEFVSVRIAEATGEEVLVENGGDLSLFIKDVMVVGLWAGASSPFSGRIGLRLGPEMANEHGEFWSVCTSSGMFGHSMSMGRADASVVLARDAALADAAATAAGNLVAAPGDIQHALDYLSHLPGVTGGIVVKGEHIGAWGDLELVQL